MLSHFLVNRFIQNKDDVKNEKVRNSYGLLGGVVGIVINSLLFAIKISIGLITSSIAIMADAFNNLSDAASSIITIIGFKMADKPADEKHPFGHGRMEYISALIVAFMVMLVGFQFIKSSVERILNPISITFELIPFILLIISISLKLWISKFNKFIGNKIDSGALKAASVDALGDVFTSSCVAISFLASKFTSFPIDGYFGVIVALFIVYSGFSLVKETINPLLGEAPDPELVKSIKDMVLSYDNINGVHDLVIHNYGPGRCMASLHAEIPSDISVMKIHEIIDQAEREISNKLNIYIVIHMDPVCVTDSEVNDAFEEVNKIIQYNPLTKSMHDFRVIGTGDNKTLIFDVVVNSKVAKKIMSDEEIKEDIISAVKHMYPNYECLVTIDHYYQ